MMKAQNTKRRILAQTILTVVALWNISMLIGCASAVPQSTNASSPTMFKNEHAVQSPSAATLDNAYPPATPIATGVVLPATAACPNSQGLTMVTEPPSTDTISKLLTSLYTADVTTRRSVTDPAFWPLLKTISTTTKVAIAPDRIALAQPARNAPYA